MSSLAPLLEKRRVQRQSSEQALAQAISAHTAAARAAVHAHDALAAHLARAPAPAASGTATGLVLARAAAFAQRHAERAGKLKLALARAEQLLAERAVKVEHAQCLLAKGSADERAVEQHLAREHITEARARHRREQEAQDEDAAARIFARKGSAL
jgi:hypothetical protein